MKLVVYWNVIQSHIYPFGEWSTCHNLFIFVSNEAKLIPCIFFIFMKARFVTCPFRECQKVTFLLVYNINMNRSQHSFLHWYKWSFLWLFKLTFGNIKNNIFFPLLTKTTYFYTGFSNRVNIYIFKSIKGPTTKRFCSHCPCWCDEISWPIL